MDLKYIKEQLDERVLGQHEAKRMLVFLSQLAAQNCSKWEEDPDQPMANAVGMLIGRTGTGKTFLCKSLADILGLSFLRVDCSSLPAPPWEGSEREGLRPKLLGEFRKVGFKQNKLQHKYAPNTWLNSGLILFDEFDKGLRGSAHDFKADAAAAMLDLFNDLSDVYQYDIRGSVVVFAGSFEMAGLHDQKRGVGFTSSTAVVEEINRENKTLGIPTELLYRIPHFAKLEKLTPDELYNILDKEYIDLYRRYSIDTIGRPLQISEEQRWSIVELASKSHGGARALHSELSKVIIEEFTGELYVNETTNKPKTK